jgi:segregation and condensation protein A
MTPPTQQHPDTMPDTEPAGEPAEQAVPPETTQTTQTNEGADGDLATGRSDRFQVHLDDFDGPFDLLLGLIAKHKLDVTTLALSKVTDDFIAFIRARGVDWDLDQTTEFLVVAATLLDLKAARLLPSAEVEDEEDLALLEARDLLFARLLQYRAYKKVATELGGWYATQARRYPRQVTLEPAFADLLPEVLISVTPEQFAALAVRAMTPRQPPTVSITHLHQVQVSVREQVGVLVARLRELRQATFRTLIADCADTLTIVARFLGLLELFREAAVSFDQVESFGELTVRWTGSDHGDVARPEAFDEFDVDDVDNDDVDNVDDETATDTGDAARGSAASDAPAPADPSTEIT